MELKLSTEVHHVLERVIFFIVILFIATIGNGYLSGFFPSNIVNPPVLLSMIGIIIVLFSLLFLMQSMDYYLTEKKNLENFWTKISGISSNRIVTSDNVIILGVNYVILPNKQPKSAKKNFVKAMKEAAEKNNRYRLRMYNFWTWLFSYRAWSRASIFPLLLESVALTYFLL